MATASRRFDQSRFGGTLSGEYKIGPAKVGVDGGISAENAVALVVNGFCREVLQQLPMEFAVEAQKLVAISLEGSVG